MKKIHLHDLSLGGKRIPACQEVSEAIEIDMYFDKLKPEQKCEKCADERALAVVWERTCKVCGVLYADHLSLLDHMLTHVLCPASYRNEPLAFVVRMQSYYDESSRKARTLAHAYAELKQHHATLNFVTVPSRMELTKDGQNSLMLGDAHVVDYLIVQK